MVEITKEVIKEHGLTEEEYQKIKSILGRQPNITELGIFSVMWSEHCSYKSSKPVLKLFPTKGERILQGPGENAGVVDIGDGDCVVMKIESHNHPSAVDPFAGAATGIGGVLRDIFTMGARPVAVLDSLRFGCLEDKRTREIFQGVGEGAADYANTMEIPVVGGEVCFDDSYQGNPLVNVMCVGLGKKDALVKGIAKGAGNPVFYVGAATGSDGVSGASFASQQLSEEVTKEDKPNIPKGDPVIEKSLMEACLELAGKDYLVAMQDMGAAGLTCSTCETASRGNLGEEIDIADVPRREKDLTAYQIMLSESQERMLVIIKAGQETEAKKIFDKWHVPFIKIGQVTSDGILRVKEKGKVVAEIPAKAIAEDSPVYERPSKRPAYLDQVGDLDPSSVKEPADYNEVLLKLLASPTIASKKSVYQQFNPKGAAKVLQGPPSDAVVLEVPGTKKAIALTTDCNGRYCYLDPYRGGQLAVAEAARNLSCVGAEPLAVTDGLNFGSAENPEIFWQFKNCVQGIADGCKSFNAPVVSGNCSFYNETAKGPIDPTPIIGMLGLIEDSSTIVSQGFKQEGDVVVLLGESKNELGASQYLLDIHGLKKGPVPELDVEREKSVQKVCRQAIRERLLHSAHDCSEGGLAVALAECCITGANGGLGVEVECRAEKPRHDAILFGESQSRIIVSCPADKVSRLEGLAREANIPCHVLGKVGGDKLVFSRKGQTLLAIGVKEIAQAWEEAIGSYFQ